eukprot:SM000344S13019  [mRNA]  locus=s344:60541:61393:- [translate_table: standard]
MLAAFSADIDDGSLEQVAGEVMQLYAECADGDYEGVARLRAAAGTAGGSSVALASCQQRPGMGAHESMEVDSSSNTAAPDLRSPTTVAATEVPALSMQDVADGWEMATSRARRRGHVGS